MDEDRLAGLEASVIEQHVLDGPEGDRRAGRVLERDRIRDRQHQPGRHVHELAREAVKVKPHDAAHLLAEVVAALAAGAAAPAGQGAIHDDPLAG